MGPFYVLFLSDGKLDIVVPSFVHYLEVLEGSDGDKMPGNNWNFYIEFSWVIQYVKLNISSKLFI